MNAQFSAVVLLALCGAGGAVRARHPVNIINSSDQPWHLRILHNNKTLRIKTEHCAGGEYREIYFPVASQAQVTLAPQSVVSIEAIHDQGAGYAVFRLLDHDGLRPRQGGVVYVSPAPGAENMGLQPALMFHCRAADQGRVAKVVRRPSPRILQILQDDWNLYRSPADGLSLTLPEGDAEGPRDPEPTPPSCTSESSSLVEFTSKDLAL